MHKEQETLPNKQFNKDVGKIKWNDRSDVSYYNKLQTRDNDESLELNKMLSPIAKRAQSTFFFAQNEFNPIVSPKQANPTYSKKYNQRKLNDTVQKKVPSSSPCSKSIINTMDSGFAIQSQPNQLKIDRSYYFDSQQTDYNQIVNSKQADKQISALKFVKVMQKINPQVYIKRLSMIKVIEKSNQMKQIESKSFQSRQLQYIDMLYSDSDNNQRRYNTQFYNRKIQNIKIPYYNKLVGLCSPQLITKQVLKTTDKNVQEIKIQKQLKKQQSTPSKSDKSFIFNFDITPRPPVDYEKRIVKDSYSSLKFSSQKKKSASRMY